MPLYVSLSRKLGLKKNEVLLFKQTEQFTYFYSSSWLLNCKNLTNTQQIILPRCPIFQFLYIHSKWLHSVISIGRHWEVRTAYNACKTWFWIDVCGVQLIAFVSNTCRGVRLELNCWHFHYISAVTLIPSMYNSGCVLHIILDSWENWSFGLMLMVPDDELLNHQND